MVEGEETKTTPRAVVFRLGATGRTLGYAPRRLPGRDRRRRRPGATRAADGRRRQRPPDRRAGPALDRPGRRRPLGSARPSSSCTRRSSTSTRTATSSAPTRSARGWPSSRWWARAPSGWRSRQGETAAELHATLVGRDGSAFGLSANEPATVPVGDYRLGTVTATFDDPQGGPNWSFIFSDNGAGASRSGTPSRRTARSRSTRSATLDMQVTGSPTRSRPPRRARTSCCVPCSTPATGS